MASFAPPTITPRNDLDFGLDASVPRHWFGGDAFRTRLFDALSLTFPEGERFFIACVRDFLPEVHTPQLRQDVDRFTRQEVQHRQAHRDLNARLASQGVKVDKIEAFQTHYLFDVCRRHLSARHTLALTAAAEHLTAIMSQHFFERPALFADAAPRVRALLAWHAVEEVEHKGVAFDVLQQVARGGYLLRSVALLNVTFNYMFQLATIINHMLKVDGFGRWQRWRLWARGLWWLWKPGGLLSPLLGAWLAWFRPGFHPWDTPMLPSFQRWADTLARTGCPVAAANALQGEAAGVVAHVTP